MWTVFKKIDRVILLLILFEVTYSLTTIVYVSIKYRKLSMVLIPVLITMIGICFYIVYRSISRKFTAQLVPQADVDRLHKNYYDSKWFVLLHALMLLLFVSDIWFLYYDTDYKETDRQFKEALSWYEEADDDNVVPLTEIVKLNSNIISCNTKRIIITGVEMVEDVTDLTDKIKNMKEKSKEEQKQVIEESKSALAEKRSFLESMERVTVLNAFFRPYLFLYYFFLYPRSYYHYKELQKSVR